MLSMGDLRDQLKKAKLLSKKDAKRLAHEERLHRKQVGRDGLEQQQRERTDELAELQQSERQRTCERQADLDADRQLVEERAACEELLRSEVRAPARGGHGKFYFALEDGRVPSMVLTEGDRQDLLGGKTCVVRSGPSGSHVYGLLAAPLASRVRSQIPDRVVWSAPGKSPESSPNPGRSVPSGSSTLPSASWGLASPASAPGPC